MGAREVRAVLIQQHAERELIDAADDRQVRERLDFPPFAVEERTQGDRRKHHGNGEQLRPSEHPEKQGKDEVVVELRGNRPAAVRQDGKDRPRRDEPCIPRHLRARDDRDADDRDDDREQREEAQRPVPEEGPVVDGPALEELREQVAAQRHEQGHAGVALVQQGHREERRNVLVRNGGAGLAMREVPGHDHERGQGPHVIERDEVGARGRLQSGRLVLQALMVVIEVAWFLLVGGPGWNRTNDQGIMSPLL